MSNLTLTAGYHSTPTSLQRTLNLCFRDDLQCLLILHLIHILKPFKAAGFLQEQLNDSTLINIRWPPLTGKLFKGFMSKGDMEATVPMETVAYLPVDSNTEVWHSCDWVGCGSEPVWRKRGMWEVACFAQKSFSHSKISLLLPVPLSCKHPRQCTMQ